MTSNNVNSQKEASEVGAELLASCLAGDRRGQLKLYESTHGLVYRLMVRMVGFQEAADLTQQVYLKLFSKIDQFSGHSRFETWLYRLAMNEALQYLRKNSRKKTAVLAGDPVSPQRPEAERGEQREILEVAMSRIDPELRSIFLLREVEGMSYRDIAEVVEIPEGTVGSRLNRARRDLQNHLLELGWRA
ncbi:MAG: RNA polymerase sigma factor [Planctomycetaceae bacterium]|nr:RNA polymerase sigma factor [Planctomycetaceae bacterium]